MANRNGNMGDVEQRIHLAIGSAAAAAAIFAPLAYKWKGILTGVAAEEILAGVYRWHPVKRLINIGG